jgi:RimJ/RimL family protein N-acetyltransferase
MLTLARHVGMVEDGVRRRHYLCDGMEVDVIHLALFREARHDCSL